MSRYHDYDPRLFRNALGCFPTGITVVSTCTDDGHPVGVTMNSFNSVSLDPPLVLFSLDRKSDLLPLYCNAENFSISILSASQKTLSDKFSRPQSHGFDGIDYDIWETGCPIIPGALANLECAIERRVDAGDHIIFLCRVLRFDYLNEGAPLVYHRGTYGGLQDA